MKIAIVISLIILIKHSYAGCPNGVLYCFDSNDKRLGQITVGQCFFWSKFRCNPCLEYSTSVKAFIDYLLQCQHHYPKTVKVLDRPNTMNINFLLDPFGTFWEAPLKKK